MSIKNIKDLNNIFCKGYVFKIKEEGDKADKYVFGYKHLKVPYVTLGKSETYFEISTNRQEYSGWEINRNPSKYRKEVIEHTKNVDGNIIILDESYFQKFRNYFIKLKTQIRKKDRIFIEDKELQAMIEKVTQKTSNEDIQKLLNKIPKSPYNNSNSLYFKHFGVQLKITEHLENAQIFNTISELLGVISSADLSRYSAAGALMSNILPNIDNITEKFEIMEISTQINQQGVEDLLSCVTIELISRKK
jgi:hypothetical protein